MKVTVYGPMSHAWSWGGIDSWHPDHAIEVDDADEERVGYFHVLAGLDPPLAKVTQDVKPAAKSEPEKPPEAEEPAEPEATLAELRAEAEKRGLPAYGSKAQLTERLAQVAEEPAETETPASPSRRTAKEG